jgi:hypothetical protein
VVDTCENSSLNYDPFYREACFLFPDSGIAHVPLSTPKYKNRFCESCHRLCAPNCLLQRNRHTICRSYPVVRNIGFPLLSSLFRFSGTTTQSDLKKRVCNDTYILLLCQIVFVAVYNNVFIFFHKHIRQ